MRKLRLLCFAMALATSGTAPAADAPSFAGVVALEYAEQRILCSGVVLTERLVLTAAHCLCAEIPIYAFIGRTVFSAENAGLQRRVNLALARPSFFLPDFCARYAVNRLETMRGNDLALLSFEHPLSNELRDIVLDSPLSKPDLQFERILAAGFGESNNLWRPGRKSFAELDLIARLCSAADEQQDGCKAQVEMIASRPPHDTCYADSGGGLYGVTSEGYFYLLGITARGWKATANDMCGVGGIYTSLEAVDVRTWLSHELATKRQEGPK